ncbi:MAG: PilZ domain-containing protein [Magnetococcales bacterium]|nr:PilZ domain-containing protein [Magnetococcales bacterium]
MNLQPLTVLPELTENHRRVTECQQVALFWSGGSFAQRAVGIAILMNRESPALGTERRHFSRVHFQHELVLTGVDGKVYPGAFNDISLKGMLFWSGELPVTGETVQGVLPLGDDEMRIRGRVLWSNMERGAAIHFEEMDVESFSHLRRLVGLNMGDANLVDQELFSSL